jgi:hypothetical protein
MRLQADFLNTDHIEAWPTFCGSEQLVAAYFRMELSSVTGRPVL